MAFKLQKATIDLGQTQIENIFIKDFMPTASGVHVKVYLMAYYLASAGNGNFTNADLAKQLDLPLADIIDAWNFWQKQGIVKIENVQGEESDVVFLSIRQLFLESNYIKKTFATESVKSSALIESSLQDQEFRTLLKDIEETCIKRPLRPDEVRQVIKYIQEYKMDYDLVYHAFYLTFINKAIKGNPFNYVHSIVENWQANKIHSMDDLSENQESYSELNQKVNRLIKVIGLSKNNTPQEIRQTLKHWLEQEEYSEEYLTYVINQTAKQTTNLNINFLQYKLDEIKKTGLESLEGAKAYFQKNTRKSVASKPKKNKFNNFSQNTYADMSEDELNKIIEQKRQKKTARKEDGSINQKNQ